LVENNFSQKKRQNKIKDEKSGLGLGGLDGDKDQLNSICSACSLSAAANGTSLRVH